MSMPANRFSQPLGARNTAAEPERAPPLGVQEMALDTLAAVLRTLGEYALEQAETDPAAFAQLSERWAQHVLVAAPSPGSDGRNDARRDWQGVREFVRGYCQNSTSHTKTVISDLRQVVWVFIQNLSQTMAHAAEADNRVREQLGRLEALAHTASTTDLKREVLSTVMTVAQVMEDRKRAEHARVSDLGDRVRRLGAELESVRKESEIDPLTRLYNRKTFDTYLARTIELAQAFGQDACLMFIDVDRFKPINDTFGHLTGDTVLSQIADVLSRIFLRKSDFVARYGGDELAVVLRETNLREAAALAERLLKATRGIRLEREGTSFGVTVSVGVGLLSPADDSAAWIARSDQALYAAKHGGRDRVVTAAA